MTTIHQVRVRVSGIDTDASGRIHFTAVFRWVELAEAGLMRELGLLDDWWEYPRRHVEAEYFLPMHFNDEVVVTIGVERLGNSSVTWGWSVTRNNVTCASGRSTVVHVDSNGAVIAIGARFRALLTR